jgi:exodeoxyribonuclease V alpha subunit
LLSKVLVITGGPGVGKTTLINAILSVLASAGVRIPAMATGRSRRRRPPVPAEGDQVIRSVATAL